MASLVCRRSSPGHLKKINHILNSRLISVSQLTYSYSNSKNLNFPRTEDELCREKEEFIPLTKHTLFRYLVQDENLFDKKEKKLFENLSPRLGFFVHRRYHENLNDLKNLFEPINPDMDTTRTRAWTRRERMDNEFWLLKGLSEMLLKANFKEISVETIKRSLLIHTASEGVRVEVDATNYDIIKFWALGKEKTESNTLLDRFLSICGVNPANEQYKRIVVASRLRKDDKLSIKAFKDISSNSLEQLLPDAKIRMSWYDNTVIGISAGLAGLGGISQIIAYLTQINVTWPVILILITATKAIHSMGAYQRKRNRYLLQLHKLLYNKNIANNRGLLTLIIDRAEDEVFKEILLLYSFLLTQGMKHSSESVQNEIEGLSISSLERTIESWILKKTGREINFNSHEAMEILYDLKLISMVNEKLFCLPPSKDLLQIPTKSTFDMLDKQENDGFDEGALDMKPKKRFQWF